MSGLLIVLTGLPGVGKSRLARIIRDQYSGNRIQILEGDSLIKKLFPQPTYKTEELVELHRYMRVETTKYLQQGYTVIYDATNVLEEYRKNLRILASRSNASCIVVYVASDENLVRNRLDMRPNDNNCNSEADYNIYERMKKNFQPVLGDHITIISRREGFDNLSELYSKIKLAID